MNCLGSYISKRIWFLIFLCLSVVMISGCSNGSDTSDSSAVQSEDATGSLAVSLTDAEGDFASYTVDVVSLTLTKANGTQVSVLPLATRIDFAQYTDMTEFLTVATLPLGAYTAATMTLDYTDADIWVENAAGDLVQVDTIVDEQGQSISQIEVSVQLEGRNHLVIARGVPMHLALDFDLRATNQTVFDSDGIPTMSVDPYLVADVNRNNDKIHRARGLLDEVDTDNSQFTVFVRPFFCPLNSTHSYFGTLTVQTDQDTLFEIDGLSSQGADGLTQMLTLDRYSAVVVFGNLKFDPVRFEADHVYAGSSVLWNDMDVASGSVVARTGDVLTVKGVTLQLSNGLVTFQNLVTVEVGDDTVVTRQLSSDAYSIDDISIGQRIVVAGELTDSDPDHLQLDATQGFVRLNMTAVRGTVLDITPADTIAQLHVDLQSINLHRVGVFDFTGTGIDAAHDAVPDDYEINTADLEIADLYTGVPVKIRGFVQPFGLAPQDFNAQSIINVANVRALLKVHWQPSTTNAFEQISNQGLILNLDEVTQPYQLFRAWVLTDLAAFEHSPLIVPDPDGLNLFVIRSPGAIKVLTSFEEFVNTLEDQMGTGSEVKKIWAVGAFDDAAEVFTANKIDIHIR